MENESLFQEGGGGSKERLRLPGRGFAVTSQSRHGRSWKPLLAPAQLCPAVPRLTLPAHTHTQPACAQKEPPATKQGTGSFITDKLGALSRGAVTNSILCVTNSIPR